MKHAYTQQLDVSISEYFTKGSGKENKQYFGQKTFVKVVKNKIAPPYRNATIDLYYEHGMDRIMELVLVAKEINVLNGTSWLTFIDPTTGEVQTDSEGNDLKWNGVKKTVQALTDDIENNEGEIYTRIEDTVNKMIRG